MSTEFIPGTVIPYSHISGSMFDYFRPIISAAGGLSLGQICTMTGLEVSTIQNWVKRGFVPHPEAKKYAERHLARILLISALRSALKIDQIGELLEIINGDTDDVSDDIIDEAKLYDYFCIACNLYENEENRKEISEITKDYNFKDDSVRLRLNEALSIMVLAHNAVILKEKAEAGLNRLKNEFDNKNER